MVFEVGFIIQDEAMDVARSATQGAHYHVDVIIYFLNRERREHGAYGSKSKVRLSYKRHHLKGDTAFFYSVGTVLIVW